MKIRPGGCVFVALLAIVLTAQTAAAQIGDAKCVDKANKFGLKVGSARAKQIRSCIKDEGKGTLASDVEVCAVDDPKSKVQGKRDKVSELFLAGEVCEGQAGTDLVTGAATINDSQEAGALALAHDLFGADLDGGQIVQTSPGNKCQDKVYLRSFKMMETWLKLFRKCKKDAMKDGAATVGEVVTACLTGAGADGSGSALPDPSLKVAGKGDKLADDVQARCVDESLDLDLMFPGHCVGGGVQGNTVQCLQDLAECHACKAVKDADDMVQVSCDVVDNGVLDDSCPELVNADECEVLNNVECLLPYPSSRFLVTDPSTDTGLRVDFPAIGMPSVLGPAWSPAPYNQLDGFSPMSQVLMHFPQGVDLELTDAGRLLAPGCCSQPAGPPWIDTRTYIDRSLDLDSPSVLMRADTGERILHWLEVDGRATGANIPDRQVVFLRPGESLVPGERYIVAMRNLKAANGDDIVAEAAFDALRDNELTGIPAIENRRAQMESDVFTPLTNNGVARNDLVLAFDFTVQSEDQLNRQMLSMRDQAFDWLDTVESNIGQVTFSVSATTPISPCNPGDVVWRKVSGTYQSPLFLTGQPVQSGAQFLNVDGNDVPVQNGFMHAPFDVTIPCSVFDGGVTSRPIVLGHGIFGTGEGMVDTVPFTKSQFADWTYIGGATDWIGLSSRRDDPTSDFLWIGLNIVGLGSSQFNNFPAFPDRLRQGMLNTLVLGKMMKLGLFNRHTSFEKSPGVGVFPGPTEEMYYYGISLGGVHGTWFAGLTPDVDRFGLDVPSVNFSCLLQRSTQFSGIRLGDQLGRSHRPDGLRASDQSRPRAVGQRRAGRPRPPHHERPAARQRQRQAHPVHAGVGRQAGVEPVHGGIRAHHGAAEPDRLAAGRPAGIPDLTGPVDSAYLMYDTGAFDLFNPAHQPHIPPLSNIIPTTVCDPHGGPRQFRRPFGSSSPFSSRVGRSRTSATAPATPAKRLEIPGGGDCDLSSPLPLQGASVRYRRRLRRRDLRRRPDLRSAESVTVAAGGRLGRPPVSSSRSTGLPHNCHLIVLVLVLVLVLVIVLEKTDYEHEHEHEHEIRE